MINLCNLLQLPGFILSRDLERLPKLSRGSHDVGYVHIMTRRQEKNIINFCTKSEVHNFDSSKDTVYKILKIGYVTTQATSISILNIKFCRYRFGILCTKFCPYSFCWCHIADDSHVLYHWTEYNILHTVHWNPLCSLVTLMSEFSGLSYSLARARLRLGPVSRRPGMYL